MVLYSAVSSPLDRSKRFTLSSPGRPVHSDTVLGFSWKHSSHAAIAQRLFTHISTTVYSQVLIYIAESTHHSSSLGSRCVPWLGEGLSMLSPNYPVLCFPLPYRVAPVFVQVVSPSLGWSPLSSFLVIWSPTGDTRGPSVVFEAVDMPCPGPFHFSYSVDYIYDFCPLPDPDVGLSVFVCDVEHTSFQFCLCGRKFVLCLFGQCPCLCTICHSWQHTGVVHLSL